MKVILDTHVFLWGLAEPEKLSVVARRSLASSEVFWSVACIWEVMIKVQLGKLRMPASAGDYLISKMTANGVSVLPIRLEHVLCLEKLPMHHRDPFDRMLIAQSMEEGWPIITADSAFRNYPVQVIW